MFTIRTLPTCSYMPCKYKCLSMLSLITMTHQIEVKYLDNIGKSGSISAVENSYLRQNSQKMVKMQRNVRITLLSRTPQGNMH